MKSKIEKVLQKSNQKGQASLEFVLTFTLSLSFVIVFIYFAFNYAVGYLAHYATFQSSRAFLTADKGSNTLNNFQFAKQKATDVFNKFPLKSFGVQFDGIRFNEPGTNAAYPFIGAYLLFDPPFKIGEQTESRDLLSESFLGKEATRASCRCQLKQAMGFNCTASRIAEDISLYDNGC